MQIGLRIDVDTLRGTRDGVPALCRSLSAHAVQASFFFSVGPDNMGRHLRRLVRPQFLRKMLRSNASGLYGWDIMLQGTFWPGKIIGKKMESVIRQAAEAGHEIGLHAWDHYAWQAKIERMDRAAIQGGITRGMEMLVDIIGEYPQCSAAPGWKCTDQVLLAKENFPFLYNSDCRGDSIFRPVVDGTTLARPQVPVTLPTYDELIGRNGITPETYNDHMLSLLRSDKLNVLTIHAEVEGIMCAAMFQRFMEKALAQGHKFIPLGKLISQSTSLPDGFIRRGFVEGREGWVAVQEGAP